MEGFSKIGIDWWSVLLYLINYGILLVVLAKFVYPRILKAVDARRQLISENINDANSLRAELVKQTELAEKDRKALLKKLEEETALVKKELQQKKKEMLDQIAIDREKLLADARLAISEEKQQLIAEVETKLIQVVQSAVLHIAMTEVSEKTVAASINKSWQQLEKKL
ncbi:hypothetical protein KBB08_00700 [Candidatus Gracilibacteria bacterium]|nr:hypothetical protein [Candidatus Gracilibacteria bacterium]